MNVSLFLDSLKIMGLGMLGILLVTMVLIGVMVLMTRLFSGEKDK